MMHGVYYIACKLNRPGLKSFNVRKVMIPRLSLSKPVTVRDGACTI